MKRFLTKMLVLCMLMFTLVLGQALAEDASGTNGNLSWTLKDGVLTISGTGEMASSPSWKDYSSSIKSVVIEKGVTSISASAFSGCSSIKSVSIPDTVTNIEYGAFYNCISLSKVTGGNGVKKIGRDAFSTCTALASITLGKSLETIDTFAFCKCTNLRNIEIPESVSVISSQAFSYCSKLEKVVIKGKTSIGSEAFSWCSSLSEIDFGKTTNIGSYAFTCCNMLTRIVLPGSINTIESYAFENCKGLETVIIEEGVNNIGSNAFLACSSLCELDLGSVKSLGSGSFERCVSLKSVTIPDSVTVMNSSVFSDCKNLVSVKVGENLTYIPSYAFQNCVMLENVHLNDNIVSIGERSFYGCKSLKEFTFTKSVVKVVYNAFGDCTGLEAVYFDVDMLPPSMSSTSFGYDGEDFTAYYPSNWEETPTAQFGGKVTWIPVTAPKLSAQPKAVSAKEGTNASFTVKAVGTKLTYQWQVSTDSGKTWKDSGLSGNKTANLTVAATAARNNYRFRCVVTDCVGQSVTSSAVKLTVGETEKVSITTQPKAVTVDEGKNAKFTVAASSSSGSELKYQWQASTDGGKTWANSGLSGNKTATLTVGATAARSGYIFRCVVTGASGVKATSGNAKLTVKSYIKFNSQPLSQKVTNATKVKFKVSAASLTGSTLSYQWQASTDGGKTWKNSSLSGNKTAILLVEATAARSGYQFRCVVTDANNKKLISSAATMTVAKVAEKKITISSFTASQSAVAGTDVKFNVSAKTSTGTALTYQWQVSTDGGKTFKASGLTGNKTATITVGATTGRNNYQFRCVIKDGSGNSLISDPVKITVK